MRNKFFKYTILFAFFLAIFVSLFHNNYKHAEYSIMDALQIEHKQEQEDTLILVAGVGDIMMGTTYPRNVLPPDDGQYIFEDVKEYLADADVAFGNLEGPFLNEGGIPKRGKDSSSAHIVAFRMPERYAAYLKNAGFDIVSL
ncbi:MAG: hypothetical protein EHM58_14005, partial [Ignavibacteriae bacterium]